MPCAHPSPRAVDPPMAEAGLGPDPIAGAGAAPLASARDHAGTCRLTAEPGQGPAGPPAASLAAAAATEVQSRYQRPLGLRLSRGPNPESVTVRPSLTRRLSTCPGHGRPRSSK